jgi:hypothetical protein
MNTINKLLRGDYTPRPQPAKPQPPAILEKKASQMLLSEFESIPTVKRHYEEALEAYKLAMEEWQAEVNTKDRLFWDDCAKEFGVENHPKRTMLEEKAYNLGHAHGFQEVYYYYSDLVELIQ